MRRKGDVYIHGRYRPAKPSGDVCPADSNLAFPYGHPDRAAYRDGGGDRTSAQCHIYRGCAATNCNAHDQAGLL